MKNFLLLMISVFIAFKATNVLAQATLTAVTSDGKEVVLNLTDNTWKYAATTMRSDNVLFQDDLVRFVYEGAVSKESLRSYMPAYVIFIKLEALKPTQIIRYRTHQYYVNDDGSSGRYQIAVKEAADNFGNSYRVCEVDI